MKKTKKRETQDIRWNLEKRKAKVWKNLVAVTRFRYIEVLFHILYYHWGGGGGVEKLFIIPMTSLYGG